jgi:hypothetical protein
LSGFPFSPTTPPNNKILKIMIKKLFILAVSAASFFSVTAQNAGYKQVNPAQFEQLIKKPGVVLPDVHIRIPQMKHFPELQTV